MPQPSALQVRNILMAVLMAVGAVWNVLRDGQVWLTAIFAVSCVLAIGSAVLNRNASR